MAMGTCARHSQGLSGPAAVLARACATLLLAWAGIIWATGSAAGAPLAAAAGLPATPHELAAPRPEASTIVLPAAVVALLFDGEGVAPAPYPGRLLAKGLAGEDVRILQRFLNEDGASPRLRVDGIFGPRTRRAVVAFQHRSRLVHDGIVGPKTWAAGPGAGLPADAEDVAPAPPPAPVPPPSSTTTTRPVPTTAPTTASSPASTDRATPATPATPVPSTGSTVAPTTTVGPSTSAPVPTTKASTTTATAAVAPPTAPTTPRPPTSEQQPPSSTAATQPSTSGGGSTARGSTTSTSPPGVAAPVAPKGDGRSSTSGRRPLAFGVAVGALLLVAGLWLAWRRRPGVGEPYERRPPASGG